MKSRAPAGLYDVPLVKLLLGGLRLPSGLTPEVRASASRMLNARAPAPQPLQRN